MTSEYKTESGDLDHLSDHLWVFLLLSSRGVQVVFLLHLLQVGFLLLGVQLLEGLVGLVVEHHQVPANGGLEQKPRRAGEGEEEGADLLQTLKPER